MPRIGGASSASSTKARGPPAARPTACSGWRTPASHGSPSSSAPQAARSTYSPTGGRRCATSRRRKGRTSDERSAKGLRPVGHEAGRAHDPLRRRDIVTPRRSPGGRHLPRRTYVGLGRRPCGLTQAPPQLYPACPQHAIHQGHKFNCRTPGEPTEALPAEHGTPFRIPPPRRFRTRLLPLCDPFPHDTTFAPLRPRFRQIPQDSAKFHKFYLRTRLSHLDNRSIGRSGYRDGCGAFPGPSPPGHGGLPLRGLRGKAKGCPRLRAAGARPSPAERRQGGEAP